MQHDIKQQLASRKHEQLYRTRQNLASAQGRIVVQNKTEMLNFCSNDYLGLANHSALKKAAIDAIENFGTGAGASHLVCGHSALHEELEELVASWLGRERALLFGSGYLANLGVISAFCNKQTHVLEDKLNHASLIDGGLLSGAKFSRYLHCDNGSLRKKLAKADQAFVVSDSVFSMDGDIAPLSDIAASCQQYKAKLYIDDAHGIGVLGNTGAGAVEHFALSQQQAPLTMITLGKALGGYGAVVAGSDDDIEYLIQFARPYIYTTALPPAVAASSIAAIKLCQSNNEYRSKLHSHIALFQQTAKQYELPILQSPTAIQALMLGTNAKAIAVSNYLASKGIWASAIRPPTVPQNSARIRITLSAFHDEQDILLLCATLRDAMNTLTN